jgi:hypothetical protein
MIMNPELTTDTHVAQPSVRQTPFAYRADRFACTPASQLLRPDYHGGRVDP